MFSFSLEKRFWDEDGHMENLQEGSIIITDGDDSEEDMDDDDVEEQSDYEFEYDPTAEAPDTGDEVELGGEIVVYEECDMDMLRLRDQQELELGSWMTDMPRPAKRSRYCSGRRLF